MVNNCFDSYAQPYCKPKKSQCERYIGEPMTEERQCGSAHTKKYEFEKCGTPPCLKSPVVAMAYVPVQTMGEVYECAMAFKRGTLFPELDKPFTGCCRYE